MSAATALARQIRAAGHRVVVDEQDAGVIRSKRDGVLTGLFVIRDERLTYAEFGGVMYPFHPHRSYETERTRLSLALTRAATSHSIREATHRAYPSTRH